MAAILATGWEGRAAAWLLWGAWPALAGIAALAAHMTASVLPPLRHPVIRRLVLAAGALVALLGTVPLLLQADVFRPGGLLRMGVLAAVLAAAAALMALGPIRFRRSSGSRLFPVLLEGALLVPLALWGARADTPPAWFGGLLAVLGGLGLSDSLAEEPGRPSRALCGVASLFLLAVGVIVFWLAGE